jgi:hypothetical protein
MGVTVGRNEEYEKKKKLIVILSCILKQHLKFSV